MCVEICDILRWIALENTHVINHPCTHSSNMVANRRINTARTFEHVTRMYVDVLSPLTMEETVAVFEEADQGQSTLESPPNASRAGTSCTGQSVSENNPVGNKADVTWTTTADTPHLKSIDKVVGTDCNAEASSHNPDC